MQLSKYPRPKEDTGIGFQYFSDFDHYRREDLSRWLSELRSMSASWLALSSSLEQPVPEFFLREVIAGGIEPVIGVLQCPVKPMNNDILRHVLRNYSSWGAHYVYFYNEPNQFQAWLVEDWSKPRLVERFMDLLFPCLDAAADLGLYPLFTPLRPGGTYWDTAFLEAALNEFNIRQKRYLFDRMGIAICSSIGNRPLNWGKGGQKKWKHSRPYCTPHASEDHRGFYLFEWYDEIVRKVLGQSLPLISVSSEINIGDSSDKNLPSVDEDMLAGRSREMVRMLMEGELPDYLLSHAFPALAVDGDGQPQDKGWFKPDGSKAAAVDVLRALDKHPRLFSWQKTAPIPQLHHKPIHHYLLFAKDDDRIAEKDWASAINYIKHFHPSCGFNIEEAMHAEFVTIVGDALGIDLKQERMLRAAGCKVERVAGETVKETKKLLDGLAKSGQRFLSF